MIRIVFAVGLVFLLWLALGAAIRHGRAIDWPGVAFAVGFVLLAFWLHHVTGAGLLFG